MCWYMLKTPIKIKQIFKKMVAFGEKNKGEGGGEGWGWSEIFTISLTLLNF